MHDIDHIRLYDQGSKDEGIAEIEPWLKSGYASIEEKLTGRIDTDGSDDKDLFYKVFRLLKFDIAWIFLTMLVFEISNAKSGHKKKDMIIFLIWM